MKCGYILVYGFLANFFAPVLTTQTQPIENSINISSDVPTVEVKNGTLIGSYLPNFDQDVFLGIPYAQPPIGDLRFMNPQSLNSTFPTKGLEVTEYSDVCMNDGAFGDSSGLPSSEDCLTLNIIKPSRNPDYPLPVVLWIHGGGFSDGSSRRDVYNLSYIVENGVEMGKPFIGVSLNYRLGGFGFLKSDEVLKSGNTNVGLRDQLKAIEWLHENIESFGGDPNHIVIWGESAGAYSVGLLLLSGKIGTYIKGAIMESGSGRMSGVHSDVDSEADEVAFRNITKFFNCTDKNALSCLKKIEASSLNEVFSGKTKVLDTAINPYPFVDGDFISYFSSVKMNHPFFIPEIPIIIGTNTAEGTSFAPKGLNTSNQAKTYLSETYPLLRNSSIKKLCELYTGNFTSDLYGSENVTIPSSFGSQFTRLASIIGDFKFIAQSRAFARSWASRHIKVYKYRWNVADNDVEQAIGATHFQEVVYVFDNPSKKFVTAAPWNKDKSSPDLAKLISKQWISFITTLDPNNHGIQNIPEWKVFSKSQERNFVFELNNKSHMEEDGFRKEAINYVIGLGTQIGV